MRKLLTGFVVVISFILTLVGISFARGGHDGGRGRGSDVSMVVHGAETQGLSGQGLAGTVHETQAKNQGVGNDVSRAVHEAQSQGLTGQDLAGNAHDAIEERKEGTEDEKGERHNHHENGEKDEEENENER